jgi:hypothetical protein
MQLVAQLPKAWLARTACSPSIKLGLQELVARHKQLRFATCASHQRHAHGNRFAGRHEWRQKSSHWRRAAVIGGVGSVFVLAGLSSSDVAHSTEKIVFKKLKTLEDRFQKQSMLGQGGQAVVYKALDKETKKFVAIKVTDKQHPDGKNLVICAPICQFCTP